MPASRPSVSIIVAIYNVEDYLEQCLDSIVSQSFTDIEILLVDDGSTDRSLEICSRYEAEDERIIVIHQENAGVSSARNSGLRAATGEWIMFVDGDDWLTQDSVKALYQGTVHNEDCDIAVGSYYENFAPPIGMEIFVGGKSFPDEHFFVDLSLRRNDIICYALTGRGIPELAEIFCNLRTPWAKLFRYSLLKDNGITFIPELDKGEDRIFNLYALKAARKLLAVNAPVYHTRFRLDSLSRKYEGIQALSDSVALWVREVREFLKQFSDLPNEVYTEFLFSVSKTAADFCFKGYLAGSMSRREAAKNMRLLFRRDIFRNMIQTIHAGRRKAYFSTKDRFVFAMLRFHCYALYLILRHGDFYRDIRHQSQEIQGR